MFSPRIERRVHIIGMARSSDGDMASASSSFFAPRISEDKTTNPTNPTNGGGSSSRDNNADQPPMIHHVCRPPKQLPPLASGESWKSKIRFLSPNKSSWVLHVPKFYCSPRSSMSKPTNTFREFWKTRPKEQHSLVLFGRKVLENRYSTMYSTTKSVGNYTYSGSSRPCKVCDAGKQPHEKFVLDLCTSADAIARQLLLRTTRNDKPHGATSTDTENNTKLTRPQYQQQPATPVYNACLVNWYTPEHTIGLHSDDEPELDTSWPIFSLSWGGPRRFLLRPKTKSNNPSVRGATHHDHESKAQQLHEFVLKDGDLLVMGGKCQDEFKHEIPKVRSTKDGVVGNRISWTIRRMRPTKTKIVVTANNKSATSKISGGREVGKHHPHEKSSATKRAHEESSESSSSNHHRPVIQPPNKPRKKGTIYNPYARSRA
jgi:alkylated DNA repair dioxygenase AlkB